jgi:hypothetical protein
MIIKIIKIMKIKIIISNFKQLTANKRNNLILIINNKKLLKVH